MADAIAISKACDHQHPCARPGSDGDQRQGLKQQDAGGKPSHIDSVDDPRQDHPADQCGDARGTHQKACPMSAQHRLGQLHMVGDEADLNRERKREAGCRAPQQSRAVAWIGDRNRRRRDRFAGCRNIPIAIQPEIFGMSIAQDNADQRQQHGERQERCKQEPGFQAESGEGGDQKRNTDDGTKTRAHQGQGHRSPLMPLEPGRDGGRNAGRRQA